MYTTIHILYMYVGSPDTIVLSISEDSGGTDSLLTLMGQSAQEYLMDRIGTCSHQWDSHHKNIYSN